MQILLDQKEWMGSLNWRKQAMKKTASESGLHHDTCCIFYQIAAIIVGTTEMSTPAATADPITPDTLGPISCMRR